MTQVSVLLSVTLVVQHRLAVHLIFERVRALRCRAHQYSHRNALAVLVALRGSRTDERGRNRYRKTDLTLFVTQRQIWGC